MIVTPSVTACVLQTPQTSAGQQKWNMTIIVMCPPTQRGLLLTATVYLLADAAPRRMYD
jgi:hypothetical protein